VDDFVLYLKSDFLDAVYLQQNAFDPVDASVGTERQRHVFELVFTILGSAIRIDSKEEARNFFYKLRQKFIDYNSAEWESEEFKTLEEELRQMLAEVSSELEPHAQEAYRNRGEYA